MSTEELITTQTEYALTPLMKQYYGIKRQYPNALLLFRTGDFYETFGDDAKKASKILDITLTKRANGSASSVPLAGFPHHAIDVYLPKLVSAGVRVAICEQLEDPKQAKGIIKRGVTELVTPGVTLHDTVLKSSENSFLASIYYDKKTVGVAMVDITTGEFYTTEGSLDYIEKILNNLPPKELLYSPEQNEQYLKQFGDRYYTYQLDKWAWNHQSNQEKLERQFSVNSLKGFGIDDKPLAIIAAGAILHYLDYTQHKDLAHIKVIEQLNQDNYVLIDRYTTRNLELFHPSNNDGISLFDIINKTRTPIGARMLRRWLALPLRSIDKINQRLDVTEMLINNNELRQELIILLSSIGDPERLSAKTSTRRINPREIIQLSRSLNAFNDIKIKISTEPILKSIHNDIDPCLELRNKIIATILQEPALALGKGSIISSGINVELDELRALSKNGKDYLLEIVRRESKATGINSLKINFNNVFGYFIEVRNAHKHKVPEHWVRKQTLVNAERYITTELKEYEDKILGAEEKILALETTILRELIETMVFSVSTILHSSSSLARLDAMLSGSISSLENHYCRPILNDSDVIDIKDGRHPVIERCLPLGHEYISNDVFLDSKEQQIIIITGPNMSGKSAILRQTAIITLLAQTGSFIPASSATIGVVDKIFTRVGASDNISQGESTFMVEMLESANILNNITNRSLVLLDEIGRGTSTYDGISIAWAMVEYLHSKPGARTLFATHYHELNELENRFSRIKNYNVSIKEMDDKVIFLRKLVRGGTEHSFGIHVASMAGMPFSVVSRAKVILRELEASRNGAQGGSSTESRIDNIGDIISSDISSTHQLNFFNVEDPTLSSLRKIIDDLDLDTLTPREALDKLYEIKQIK